MPHCPRDGTKLEQVIYHGIMLMKCPECNGVLLEQKDTRKLLDRISQDLLVYISPDHPIEATPPDRSRIICPYCKEPMENYSYMEAGTVHLNCCTSCQVLWADAEELGQMSLLYARTHKRMDELRELYLAKRIERANEADIMDAQRAFWNGTMVGWAMGRLF